MKSTDVYKKVEDWYFKDVSNKLSSRTSREIDPIYNDKNAPLQIHCFGDSWTFGSGVEQEQTFTHLLGYAMQTRDINTRKLSSVGVWNHGIRGAGFDTIAKKVSETYEQYDTTKSMYIITIPHLGRRVWFDDEGKLKTKKAWENEHKQGWLQYISGGSVGNEYNQYFYFFHQYMLLNRLIGKEKIIWGTWGIHPSAKSEIPANLIDIYFDCVDLVSIDDFHPGGESHMNYANKIAKVLGLKFDGVKNEIK